MTRSETPATDTRPAALSWREGNAWIADLLLKRTGADVPTWNTRIRGVDIADEAALRSWLDSEGVTGYPQMLLVMERFGYPPFFLASADELIDGQYADRPALRPIADAILARVHRLGEVTVQARKTYISLLTPRRTFATVQPTTKQRLDLGLRLTSFGLAAAMAEARGRKGGTELEPDVPPAPTRLVAATSMGNSSVTGRVGLSSPDEVDDEVGEWLGLAYGENS